jgi:hypothetical protein
MIHLTQQQANELIAKAKEAVRTSALAWPIDERQDEEIVAVNDKGLQFILTFKRRTGEVKAHFRVKGINVGLARIDNAHQAFPGAAQEVVRGPHIHWYEEGSELKGRIEKIDWYDANKPLETLYFFLDLIKTKFSSGLILKPTQERLL